MSSVAIVTGASRGLGLFTARRLAAHGYTVYGTSRSAAAGRGGGGPIHMLELDVTRPESVEACVGAVLEREGRVDLLVNNAGYPMTGAMEEVSVDEAMRQFDTNFFGALRMIHAVLPGMRSQRSGRIVNVSSAAGDIPVPFYGVYGASKAALERASLSLRAELRPFGIHVSCVTPSSHKTEVQHVLPARRLDVYGSRRDTMLAAMHETVVHGDDPEQVARAVLRAATSARPRSQYRVGGDSRAFGILLRLLPMSVLELLVRKKFALP
jgi:NAD(P)-dependent dehydrogenase (short-subunit alcohol dehydrogenase family)